MERLIITALISLISAMIGILPVYASELEAGKVFYAKKRCGMCHIIEGKGGKIGPDLSHTGSARDRAWLTAFLKDPRKMVPGAKMMPVKGAEADLAALVTYLLSQK